MKVVNLIGAHEIRGNYRRNWFRNAAKGGFFA